MTSISAAGRSAPFGRPLGRLLPLALTFALARLAAQPVQVDPAFAPVLLNDVPALTSLAFTPLANGSLLVRGEFTHIDGTAADSLALLKSTGARDAAFAAASPRSVVLAAPLSDGRLIAVTAARDNLTPYRLERLLASGASDAAYAPIDLPSAYIARLVPQPDGRVLVVGSFTTLGSLARTTLARLRVDGTLDPTFDSGTRLDSSMLINAGLAVQPDGKILFNEVLYVSPIVGPTPGPGYHLSRLNADGSPDSTFGIETLPNGTTSITYNGTPYHALAVQPDGKILAATGSRLVRFTAAGLDDATFSPAIPGLRRVDQIVALSDGRSLVQARVSPVASATNSPVTPSTIFLLNATGAVARDFRTSLPADSSIELLATQADGRFLVRYGFPIIGYSSGTPVTPALPPVGPTFDAKAGDTVIAASTAAPSSTAAVYLEPVIDLARPSLARLDLSGVRDTAFAPAFTRRSPVSVAQLIADATGRLLVAGAFTSVDAQPRPGLARFLPDGTLDPAFVPSPSPNQSLALTLAQPDGKILLHETVLGPKNADGVFSVVLSYERLLVDGSPDAAFKPTGLPADALISALDRDGRFLSSGFDPDDTLEENLKLFRLNSDGSLAASLSTTFRGFQVIRGIPQEATTTTDVSASASIYGLPNQISALQPLADGKLYVRASVTTLNGAATSGFARLNADGSTDTTYQPAVAVPIDSPAISFLSGGRLLYTTSPGYIVPRTGSTVRLLADGSLDPTFTPLPGTTIYQAFELSDGRLLSVNGYRRWLASGVPDLNYQIDLASDDRTNASLNTAAEAAGQVYLGGTFAFINGQPRTGLARLIPNESPGFTQQPQSQTVVAGRDTSFQAALGTSAPATYQWTLDGVSVPGATGPALVLLSVRPAQAGTYRLVATTGGLTYTSEPATLTITANTARLVNFSSRSRVSADAPPQIAGFVLRRNSTHPVLLRAVGRGMSYLLRDTTLLPEPLLRLHQGSNPIAENLGGALAPAIAAVARQVGAFPVQADLVHYYPENIFGSALSLSLPGGAYTAHTSATDGRPGISLFEFYDASTTGSGPAVTNFSIRARTAPGADALIAGFVINGNGPLSLLVRAIGPSLSRLGVGGALADPQLTLRGRYNIVFAQNDNWSDQADAAVIATTAQQVGAFALPAGSRDAALLVTLEPGIYTVQIDGTAGTSGEAMIELYVVEN